MTRSPRISIIVPLHNDEAVVSRALDSCLAQTMHEIEIICVHGALTDAIQTIADEYARKDTRVRVLHQRSSSSSLQARRLGVENATAPFVLFLEADDELVPHAARHVWDSAASSRADVVGFGVDVVTGSGLPPRRLTEALQPRHSELSGSDIVTQHFPAGEPVEANLRRYLFSTPLLRAAHEPLTIDGGLVHADDLPITFLALTHAKRYVSTPARLYRYHAETRKTGHPATTVEQFLSLMRHVTAISSIAAELRSVATDDAAAVLRSYESARLYVIATALGQCAREANGVVQRDFLTALLDEVGYKDVLRAAAWFCQEALQPLSEHVETPSSPASVPQRVLLATAGLEAGELQDLLDAQIAELVAAGCTVTVAVVGEGAMPLRVPDHIDIEFVSGEIPECVERWFDICVGRRIDVVIDHRIVHDDQWPWLTHAALAVDVATIGWVNDFALQPIFDQRERISFLRTHMRALATAVALSPTDVAFWKIQGVDRICFLPDPPSPLALLGLSEPLIERGVGKRVELAWWGRLDRAAKQVPELIELAAQLRGRGLQFRLTIIGANSSTLKAKELRELASRLGVAGSVELLAEQDTTKLREILGATDLMVSVSAIEGHQPAIAEAQALGIPVVMYDIPWLVTVHRHAGVIAVANGDLAALADAVVGVERDPALFSALRGAARANAERAATARRQPLLVNLLSGELDDSYFPEPTLEETSILVDWLVKCAERNIRQAGSAPDSDVSLLRRERDAARHELQHVLAGPSFRAGRALTYLPRKLRALRKGAPADPAGVSYATAHRGTPRVQDTPPPAPLLSNVIVDTTPSATPDVTFVVPVYNAAPWLDDCLSSVLAQTNVRIEVICIDDGSTDDSRRILDRFAHADPRVTVVGQTNAGQSVGRNRGAEMARGRYLIYLDSDDFWPYDALANLVQRADEDSLDVLLFDCVSFRDGDVDEDTWRRYARYYQRTYNYRGTHSGADLMVATRRARDYRPHVGLYMTRTEYLRDSGVQFIPGIIHQDNPYTFRLLLGAARAGHMRVDAYARRLRPGSTITTLNPARSARGYYLSYLEMKRALDARDVAADSAEMLNDICAALYDALRKQFALMSPKALEELRREDSRDDAQALFHTLRGETRVAPRAD